MRDLHIFHSGLNRPLQNPLYGLPLIHIRKLVDFIFD